MATSSCTMCGESRVQRTIRPHPNVAGAKAVLLALCRRCDVRQCKGCNQYVQDPTARFCRCGRDLMTAA